MFDIKKNPVVGYVAADGATRLAIVNGVAESGNPNLAVVKQVPDAPLGDGSVPGTYHLLSAEEIEALQAAPQPETAPEPAVEAPTDAAPA